MTDKQIIIDGEKENCKILFDCYHIDDSEAYRMIRNGVKITPENAPFDDFELRLISNENSVYGFTSLCKRNKNNDEWEYMGFGHSGAASVVTALLKELSRKEQECEELKSVRDSWIFKYKQETRVNEFYKDGLNQLKAENEKLDTENKRLVAELANPVFDSFEELDKLKQILTEIKEIAERAKKDICNNCGWRNTDSCDPENYTCGEFIKILQKISEVGDV